MKDKKILQIKKGSGRLYIPVPKELKLNHGDYVVVRKLDTESILNHGDYIVIRKLDTESI